MFDWIMDLPDSLPKWISILTFVVIAIWAWFRPRVYIFTDAPSQKWWCDLRIWATVFMVVQTAIYLAL